MSAYPQWMYRPAGDSAVLVEIGDAIDPALHCVLRGFLLLLRREPIAGVTECVPGYCSALVCYDATQVWYDELVERLRERERRVGACDLPAPRRIEIPVTYGGESGPDLDIVARHANLTTDEVIARHAAPDYLVYMLGFTPGFAYLGGLDPVLETPRRAEPRTAIPAGSVGIAGAQTGVYPIESPGGWQLIGRTRLRVFDPRRDPPTLLRAGDVVRFVPEN